MSGIDLERQRKVLDRHITFFHFKRARLSARQGLKSARAVKDKFFTCYFLAQNGILDEKF